MTSLSQIAQKLQDNLSIVSYVRIRSDINIEDNLIKEFTEKIVRAKKIEVYFCEDDLEFTIDNNRIYKIIREDDEGYIYRCIDLYTIIESFFTQYSEHLIYLEEFFHIHWFSAEENYSWFRKPPNLKKLRLSSLNELKSEETPDFLQLDFIYENEENDRKIFSNVKTLYLKYGLENLFLTLFQYDGNVLEGKDIENLCKKIRRIFPNLKTIIMGEITFHKKYFLPYNIKWHRDFKDYYKYVIKKQNKIALKYGRIWFDNSYKPGTRGFINRAERGMLDCGII